MEATQQQHSLRGRLSRDVCSSSGTYSHFERGKSPVCTPSVVSVSGRLRLSSFHCPVIVGRHMKASSLDDYIVSRMGGTGASFFSRDDADKRRPVQLTPSVVVWET